MYKKSNSEAQKLIFSDLKHTIGLLTKSKQRHEVFFHTNLICLHLGFVMFSNV
jgi:hypothetical protein